MFKEYKMFVSHDISPKKKIQKPNILRRKTKASNVSCLTVCETRSSENSILAQGGSVEECNLKKSNKPIQVLKLNTMRGNRGYEDANYENIENDGSPQEFFVDNSYFLKDVNEDIPLLDDVVITKDLETEKPKWMDFINNKIMVRPSDVESVCKDSAPETSKTVSSTTIMNTSSENCQDMDYSCTSNINKLMCDVNGCNKEFSTEKKLKKHKSIHKDGAVKPQRQITIECPVKVTLEDGIEKSCGRIFKVREDLSKHLNEEHTLDEAPYKCTECGRSFFWATGLRAHGRSHARPPALACAWPGCGRVFRQPCRLREHQRAHTGDKPYPCQHPNCGWSFRTASKLLRHARRHTGERRHACAECGSAFLRREHLREHAARHHAPRPHRHACTVPDCQQSFTNMSSLYTHMKRVHKNEQKLSTTDVEQEKSPRVEMNNMFMISLYPECELLAPVDVEQNVDAEEEHAARTHCTWPLDRSHAYAHATDTHAMDSNTVDEDVMDPIDEDAMDPHAIDAHAMDHAIDEDVINADAHALDAVEHEEIRDAHAEIAHDAYDVHVEQCEGTESNIYTIRSDLFLHGNLIHNEDSEHMSRAPSLDADLLDAPSVDIAQEELYSDAVDESSFRVFLLNAEELAVAE